MSVPDDVPAILFDQLTERQRAAVGSTARRLLVVAGAGSGKTDVMARRVAWWLAVDGVPKDQIVAFTFTDRAAEEMKFRIRQFVERVTPEGEDVTLGDMYVGTIHGYCLKLLRDLAPDDYHNYDILEEGARIALVQRGYGPLLGLSRLRDELSVGRQWRAGQFETINTFLKAYDLLNEYDELEVALAPGEMPTRPNYESEWCKGARLTTDVGTGPVAEAFALAAGRFYAYLRCRRFLDFSTSQSEVLRLLRARPELVDRVRSTVTHLLVDEVQDVNPVQRRLMQILLGDHGHLTCVGDHRQAIFGWRGGRVDLMAELFEELEGDEDGQIVELTHNFRSTPRIIAVANAWARTISPVRSMTSPDMEHGRVGRLDGHHSHVGAHRFDSRDDEAEWIADSVSNLVNETDGTGAVHDGVDGDRGVTFADIAILIRSGTDARTYMSALERRGIPAVFRGADLFSQPETLLLLSVMSAMAGITQYYGGPSSKSLPSRISSTLGCPAEPLAVLRAAVVAVRAAGLPMEGDAEERLGLACELVRRRLYDGRAASAAELRRLRSHDLRRFVERPGIPRRVFPQALFHFALAEAGVEAWDAGTARGESAMFHLGSLSSLVRGMETPGWTDPADFRAQMIALCQWGTESARTPEAPLLVRPDAVTISTIHSVKGLEFPVVFLADVCARRFPSTYARRVPTLPFDGAITGRIVATDLSDNNNYDAERRLMYVALTRTERYLIVSASGGQQSSFYRSVCQLIQQDGGVDAARPDDLLREVAVAPSRFKRDLRLASSLSDLRYYLECPHDFYLRKVLGFAPTIDQAFGYGRGVHNLMRAIHSDPQRWAEIAGDDGRLEEELRKLVDRGLLYLRYTVGEPQDRMERRARQIVADYVRTYAGELEHLQFEPEREFETLIEEEQVLISGAMDVIRHDDPPRVTLIDFKSGEPDSDLSAKLDTEEMRLQISLYGVAAKKELEYEPDQGLVRYLAETDPDRRELVVPLTDEALEKARRTVADTAGAIRRRVFHSGPSRAPRDGTKKVRCEECDFLRFCGMEAASSARRGSA